MSSSNQTDRLKERLWAWASAHSQPIVSLASLLSSLWFASIGVLGLLALLREGTFSLWLGIFAFSGGCLLAAALGFAIVHLAERRQRLR